MRMILYYENRNCVVTVLGLCALILFTGNGIKLDS